MLLEQDDWRLCVTYYVAKSFTLELGTKPQKRSSNAFALPCKKLNSSLFDLNSFLGGNSQATHGSSDQSFTSRKVVPISWVCWSWVCCGCSGLHCPRLSQAGDKEFKAAD